jgi:hypothetical protein
LATSVSHNLLDWRKERGWATVMVHAILFTLVLTIAAGQSASLLCVSWCVPQADLAAAGCHDHALPSTSTSVAPVHTCDDPGNAPEAVVPDDGRRHVQAPASVHVVPAFEHHVALVTHVGDVGHWATPQPARANRPLVTTLRI